jgi:3-hydroxyisobutyrate dehydrogenase-like beta-hydroxyacid dehydrogenase
MTRQAGVRDVVFFEVIAKIVVYSGLTMLKEPKLRAGDFSPQFSIKHMLKDMRLASAMQGCTDFPVLDTIRDCLARAANAGFADEDFSALIKVLPKG